MGNKRLIILVEGAIFAAIAMALSMVPLKFGPSFSISLGMIPMTLYGVRRGFGYGLFAGFLWGILHFLIGNVVYLQIFQVLIEYLLAYTFAGCSGLFAKPIQQSLASQKKLKAGIYLIAATIVGGFARYFWHFFAGVIYWGSYAPQGVSPLLYSFIMNGATFSATAVVTIIVMMLLLRIAPQIYQPKK